MPLERAEQLADDCLLERDFVPTTLRDHDSEIIGGPGFLLGVEAGHRPAQGSSAGRILKKCLIRSFVARPRQQDLLLSAFEINGELHVIIKAAGAWSGNFIIEPLS